MVTATITSGVATGEHGGRVGYASYDDAGTCTIADPAFCEIIGRNPSEVVDQPWWSLCHPDDVEPEANLFRELLEQGAALSPVVPIRRYIRADGEEAFAWVKARVSELPNDGQMVSYDIELVEAHNREFAAYVLLEQQRTQAWNEEIARLRRTREQLEVFLGAIKATALELLNDCEFQVPQLPKP